MLCICRLFAVQYNDFRSGGNADPHLTTAPFFSAAAVAVVRERLPGTNCQNYVCFVTYKMTCKIQLNAINRCHLCYEI